MDIEQSQFGEWSSQNLCAIDQTDCTYVVPRYAPQTSAAVFTLSDAIAFILGFRARTAASWQPQVRDSDAAGIEAEAAHTAALAAFNPPPIAPPRVKPALAGFDTTASGDHRLGRFA